MGEQAAASGLTARLKEALGYKEQQIAVLEVCSPARPPLSACRCPFQVCCARATLPAWMRAVPPFSYHRYPLAAATRGPPPPQHHGYRVTTASASPGLTPLSPLPMCHGSSRTMTAWLPLPTSYCSCNPSLATWFPRLQHRHSHPVCLHGHSVCLRGYFVTPPVRPPPPRGGGGTPPLF